MGRKFDAAGGRLAMLCGFLIFAIGLCAGSLTARGETQPEADPESVIELPPKGEVTTARFQCWRPRGRTVEGVVVLLDGENLPAFRFFEDVEWRRFAEAHGLVLCGPEFVSDPVCLRENEGYFNAARESGSLLLEALKQAGLENKPLWLFGFSGGARFVSSFVNWRPDLVRGWAALSASQWTPPRAGGRLPPGIVACGEYDGARYGGCLAYVQSLRRLDNPVAWVSLAGQEHRRSLRIEAFAREFFDELMKPGDSAAVLVDNGKRLPIQPGERIDLRLTSQLPSVELIKKWQQIQAP